MSKATSQAFSSYRRNRTVLSFRERYRLTVFVSNGTVAVMAQRGVSLKSVLTCYEKNKITFFFIWAVIDFMTINISWFLLNIKQHPSPISRKPQTVLNGWMAWIVCIVLFSYHKCACPMSRAIAATFWPRGRRALRARRPRGPNVKKKKKKKKPGKRQKCFIIYYFKSNYSNIYISALLGDGGKWAIILRLTVLISLRFPWHIPPWICKKTIK